MEEVTTIRSIEHAIVQNKKLLLQTIDCEDFDFILFHPYAVVLDSVEGFYIVGKEEKRKISSDLFLRRFKLDEITFLEILDVNFNPDGSLWERLEYTSVEMV